MPKNVQTTREVHSSHRPARLYSISFRLGFSSMWTKNVQIDVQAGFQRDRGTRDQIANICGIIEKAKEIHKNIYFCFIDYSKVSDYVDHNKPGEILKEMGIPDHLWPPDTKHPPWKRPWWWERLKAKGEENSRGWASPTQWTWIWANSRS